MPQLLRQHPHGRVSLAGLPQQVAASHHLAPAALLQASLVGSCTLSCCFSQATLTDTSESSSLRLHDTLLSLGLGVLVLVPGHQMYDSGMAASTAELLLALLTCLVAAPSALRTSRSSSACCQHRFKQIILDQVCLTDSTEGEQTWRRASSAVTTDPAAMLRVWTANRRISRARHTPSRLQCRHTLPVWPRSPLHRPQLPACVYTAGFSRGC